PPVLRIHELILAVLDGAGFDPDTAMQVKGALLRYCVGHLTLRTAAGGPDWRQLPAVTSPRTGPPATPSTASTPRRTSRPAAAPSSPASHHRIRPADADGVLSRTPRRHGGRRPAPGDAPAVRSSTAGRRTGGAG